MKRNIRYLFTGAGMLAVASVIAKLLGAMYRVPLTNVLGGEGMGLYQLVFPLYTLLLTVSSGGLPVAISRLVAVKLACGDEKGARRVLGVSLAALVPIGILGTALLAVFGGAAAALQGNAEAKTAYYGIAPSVAFVAVISCFRGYFQGRENMLPGAASQLVEQAGKLVFGLYFAYKLMSLGYASGVFGALAGVSLSELLAALALAATYLISERTRRRNRAYAARRALSVGFGTDEAFLIGTEATAAERTRRKVAADESEAERNREGELYAQSAQAVQGAAQAEFAGDMTAELVSGAADLSLQDSCKQNRAPNETTVRGILRELFAVAVPVAFGSLVMPLTALLDSVLVINILTYTGVGRAEATAAYGLTSGTVATLINMPVAVIFAISAALLPRVAKCCRDPERVAKEAGFSFKLCLIGGLLCALALSVFAPLIVKTLYTRGLGEAQLAVTIRLTRISAVSVFYVGVIQVATAALQGLGEAKIPAVNLVIGAVTKVAVTACLLFVLGIYGAAIGSVLCYAVTATLDVISVVKRVPTLAHPKSPLAPALAAVAFVATGIGLSYALGGLKPLFALALSGTAATVAFVAVIAAFKWFTREEAARIIPFIRPVKPAKKRGKA